MILGQIRAGVRMLLQRGALPPLSSHQVSEDELLLALRLRRYGVIYLLDRRDARNAITRVEEHPEALLRADMIWEETGRDGSVLNWAIHSLVQTYPAGLAIVDNLIPPFAFQSLPDGRIAVRSADFIDRTPEDSWQERKALYDLHDLAHLATVGLSPSLYGNYYHNRLARLPSHYQHLITSPSLNEGLAPVLSDGLLFSHLLTQLFENMDSASLSPQELVDSMATRLKSYLLAEQPLFSPKLQRWLSPTRRIDVLDLAVLAQNKSLELPASEIEQQIFTRGGVGEADFLLTLSAVDRLKEIAHAEDTHFYFEKRNVTKHRAQKEAYRLTALALLESNCLKANETALVGEIVANLDYTDWRVGSRVDLYGRVAKYLEGLRPPIQASLHRSCGTGTAN